MTPRDLTQGILPSDGGEEKGQSSGIEVSGISSAHIGLNASTRRENNTGKVGKKGGEELRGGRSPKDGRWR